MSFTWQNGRELASVVKSGVTTSYTYNSAGIRNSKTVGGVTTRYTLSGTQVEKATTGSSYVLYFYDESGTPVSFRTVSGNTTADYYYIKNLQGDIIAISDASGSKVVEYTYDAWGKVLSTTGSFANTIGATNPYRYRGYWYDTETGLYYVSSRYYDPEIGRWINADDIECLGAEGELLSYNLFAYCLNNPVNRTDVNGNWSLPNWAKVVIGVGAIIIGAAVVAATAGTAAAFVGAAAAGLKAAAVSGAIGAAVGAGKRAVKHRISTGSWNGAGEAALDGVIDGFARGFMTGGIMAGGAQILSSVFKIVANTGVPTGRNGGLTIGNKLRILSPNHPLGPETGGTLLKIGAKYENIRLDVGCKSLFHMNVQFSKAVNYHIPIGILGSGLLGGVFCD